MTLLIAAIIATATSPTFSITLSEPSRVVSATVEFQDINGQEWEFQAYPSTWVADFPASATEPGIFRIYIGDATEESEVRGGGIVWNLYPMGYRMFRPVLHTPGPIPTEYKITTWPSNPIQSWGWVKPALENYIHNRKKNHLFLLGMWYNGDINKYGFRWEVR